MVVWIGDDCWAIINDYKYQLEKVEHFHKFHTTLQEIKYNMIIVDEVIELHNGDIIYKTLKLWKSTFSPILHTDSHWKNGEHIYYEAGEQLERYRFYE